MKPHWTNPWADARPNPLGQALAAILIKHKNPEHIQKLVAMYFQFGTKLDAYVLPGGSRPTVGIRWGEEGSNYFSPFISEEEADAVGIPWRS